MANTLQLIKTVTADGSSATMDSGTLTGDLDVLRVVIEIVGGGSGGCRMRFNGNTGNNYRRLFSENGGSKDGHNDGAGNGITNMVGRVGRHCYSTTTIYNYDGKESHGHGHCVTDGANTGSANAPTRMEYAFKWAETDQINRIAIESYSSNWTSGSTMNIYAFSRTDADISNEKDALTNVEAGTRYEETDTRKIYRFKASTLVNSTYTEDMSDTTGWTFADTGAANVTGGSLSYSLNRNGSNDAASYDFGSTISDTKFVLRFSRTPTNHSHSSGSNCIGFFGLSDNTSGQGTSQDFIGFNFASNDNDGCTTKNGTTLVANSVGNHSDKHTSGTKYYEIKRNSATEVVFTVYNNSDFTGVYWTKTEDSLSSSITSLRYFKWANWHSSGSGSCNVTGTIDDLELWDNVTSAGEPAKWVERGTA